MSINYQELKNRRFDDVQHRYDATDTILYALGIGIGSDPHDLDQLRFVYEQDLLALPTMAVVLGNPGFWMQSPDAGLDWRNILQIEQEVTIHRPLEATGHVVGKTIVESVVDKRSKGALIHTRCDIFDVDTTALVATVRSGNLSRSDGNFGGGDTMRQPLPPLVSGPPDLACVLPTFGQSALIYRLSGDANPLHVDIRVAQSAGFDRPVLHGLCTFGVVGHAVLRVLCDYDPTRLKKLSARFTSPVYPGESLRTTFWKRGAGTARFECHSVERSVSVIKGGFVEYST